jgi:ATP-dependent Clp protease ATP-binding subunit ClpA
MARLIQSTIKTPLADEVLFGKLKDGGAVRVVVRKPEDAEAKAGAKDSLGFDFPAGPVTPKPEKDVTNAAKRHKRTKPRTAARKKTPKDDKGGGGGSGGVRTVPKVPLVRA